MATSTWFVMIPPTYANKSTSEKELVDFVIQYPAGSQAWKDANAGKIIGGGPGLTGQFFLGESGSNESAQGNPQIGEQLVKWKGPFATQAEAHAAANPKQQSPNPINDVTNAAENSNAIPGLSQIGNFFGALTDPNTWIRLAKVVFGGLVLVIGISHLTGADNSVANAARKIPLPI